MTPAQLAALHAKCFTSPPPWSEANFSSTLETSGTFLISQRHGFIIGREIAGEAELLTLAIDPTERRKGIATQLLTEFLQKSKHLKAQEIFLEVASDNTPAQRLYIENGFTQVGERPKYYGPTNSALILRKSLLESP